MGLTGLPCQMTSRSSANRVDSVGELGRICIDESLYSFCDFDSERVMHLWNILGRIASGINSIFQSKLVLSPLDRVWWWVFYIYNPSI